MSASWKEQNGVRIYYAKLARSIYSLWEMRDSSKDSEKKIETEKNESPSASLDRICSMVVQQLRLNSSLIFMFTVAPSHRPEDTTMWHALKFSLNVLYALIA